MQKDAQRIILLHGLKEAQSPVGCVRRVFLRRNAPFRIAWCVAAPAARKEKPEDWRYSSASNYAGLAGLIDVYRRV